MMAKLEEYPNWRYEPPITLQIANEIHQELVRNAEETILKEIVRLGVNVDRDELILALQYDRKQYEKGYADAMADYISREAANQILETAKWIPVTERLPDLGEDVLVYCKAKTPDFSDFIEVSVRNTYKPAPWCDEVPAWGIRFIPFGGEFDVTHWMPLPEPPGDEKAPPETGRADMKEV